MSHSIKPTEQTSEECRRILEALVNRVARVRIRLVIEAILQTLALGLVAIPIYVVIYAWIDHHVHLGILSRTLALIGLAITTGILVLLWARVLLSHISLSRAANYIESRHTYQQQLVAAIEYYEQETEYPYSRGLAEQMIRQINDQTRDDRFVQTVRKWPTFISLAIVLCAIICTGYLVTKQYAYYSRYFSRLVKPIAHIDPLPATDLETLSGDIFAEPREPLVLAAAIKGRIPESGSLYIESEITTDDPNNRAANQSLSIPLLAAKDKNDRPVFQAQFSLREKGGYHYYFKSGDSQSQSHTIRITEFPRIESITAKVTMTASQWIEPYTEQVKDFLMSVFEGSYITLEVKANQPLKNAVISLPNDRRLDGQLKQPDVFTTAFQITEEGKVSFSLTNTEGLGNRKPIVLQMKLRQDMPPTFELVSPGSDYIATNVASIPIEFKVSDDFALEQASLHLEFNDGRVIRLPEKNIRPGTGELTLSCLVELEEYELDISDSIIFYASAKDADTQIGKTNSTAWSTPYFIEIRPYRKLIHQPDAPMPSTEKQGLKRPEGADGLLTILEYNRAFLKKTWMLSQQKQVKAEDETRMNAISDDVTYAGGQLTLIRNNPMYGFTEEQTASIDGILDNYDLAAKTLIKHQPRQAVPPEKSGYHDLRKLIKELSECPPPAGGMPPETRDRLELKDPVHLTRYEKERVEWQLEKIAQELAELAKEQEKLQNEYIKFLEQQKKEQLTQKVNDAKTWTESRETENPRTPPSDKRPGQDQSQNTMQGAMVKLTNPPPSAGASDQPQPNQPKTPKEPDSKQDKKDSALSQNKNQSDQKQGENKSSDYAESKENSENQQTAQAENQSGSGQGQDKATASERLRMMQAQQKALQDRIRQIAKELADLPIPSEPIGNDGISAEQTRQAAKEHLEKAAEYMANFEQIMSSQYYQTEFSEKTLELASATLRQVQKELNRAEFEMAREFAPDILQLALGSENIARQLEELAKTYEQSVSEEEKRKLQQLLAEATTLLESLPENWAQELQSEGLTLANNSNINSSQPSQVDLSQNAQPAASTQNNAQPANSAATGNSGGQSGPGSLHSAAAGGPDPALIERARSAARHFWSVAIQVRKKATPMTETQYTHPEYTEVENRFFEKTATYGLPQEPL